MILLKYCQEELLPQLTHTLKIPTIDQGIV